MSIVIWKYKLEVANSQILALPLGAKILHMGNQDGIICLWVEVTDAEHFVERMFYVVGTGRPFDLGKVTYLGTVLVDPSVWHVYEAVGD